MCSMSAFVRSDNELDETERLVDGFISFYLHLVRTAVYLAKTPIILYNNLTGFCVRYMFEFNVQKFYGASFFRR